MTTLLHGMQQNNKQKGQSSIEFSIAFVVTILFLVLTARLFVWFGGSLVRRQLQYEDTRREAGQPASAGRPVYEEGEAPELDLFSEEIFQ